MVSLNLIAVTTLLPMSGLHRW